jgi:hypothetical protein
MSADPGSTTAVPPTTRDAGRWTPVLAVVAAIAVVVGGGRLAGASSSASAGPIDVGGGAVRISPLPGWAAAEPHGAASTEVVLTRGGVSLDVSAVPGFRGSPVDLATRYAQEVLGSRFEALTVGEPATGTLATGTPTLRFGYVGIADGVPFEGVATSAVGPGGGAVFDASAPTGDLAWAVSDLEAMIRSAEVG